MWHPKGHSTTSSKKGCDNGLVAVAIDKDKGSSQLAFKWAVENLLSKTQTVVLIHVIHKPPSMGPAPNNDNGSETSCPTSNKQLVDKVSKELFLTYHCFCTRKDMHSLDVVLEDSDVVKALTDYVSYAAIDKLVLGAPARSGFMRKFRPDVASCVVKAAPEFCSVYVISKQKISSLRSATRPPPHTSPLLDQIKKTKTLNHGITISKSSMHSAPSPSQAKEDYAAADNRSMTTFRNSTDNGPKSPYPPTRPSLMRAFGDLSESDTDISFVSSDRPSTDRGSSLLFDSFVDYNRNMRSSTSTEQSIVSMRSGMRFSDRGSPQDISLVLFESGISSCSSQNMDDVGIEMKRLRQELKQTMDLYGNACKEALTAKQQARELKDSKIEEQKLEEVRQAEEAAISLVNREEALCMAAMEAVQKQAGPSKQISALGEEALRETLGVKRMLHTLSSCNIKYRRYTIEEIEEATDNFNPSRKIGEGGYGPVYKCYLDHTSSAVKVLRPDAAQGRTQFLQEVEVLSCIRHPNMVLLLGACPEYGILVYEYMGRGSLDDCLFRKGNTPALSWQIRFRIASDIATGLLFLHQTKPEPIVHRDLKPANILLDQYYVSKISDVGLAKLVPAVAENATQCCVTSTAGTFCYIDPEYQQTGMLGVKSDVYSLGIILLQLVTAKPPMGLSHYVEQAIERGTFAEMLDPAVPDWPAEETMAFAKLALQCAELRRRDRPDLGKDVLPELNRFKEFAEERMASFFHA